MGTVYQGLDVENGDFVAVKQINLQCIPNLQLNEFMVCMLGHLGAYLHLAVMCKCCYIVHVHLT